MITKDSNHKTVISCWAFLDLIPENGTCNICCLDSAMGKRLNWHAPEQQWIQNQDPRCVTLLFVFICQKNRTRKIIFPPPFHTAEMATSAVLVFL